MWLSRLRTLVRSLRYAGRPARKPCRWRPQLEQLEDRALPSGYTASTTAQLIRDINASNAAGGSNTILLAANTTFDLTVVNNTTNGANGLPVIAMKDNLTINGQGGDILQRDTAAPAFRLFDVANHGALTLQNLILQNGLVYGAGTAADGGAILNQGTLTLSAVTVQNNTARGLDGANASNLNGSGQNGQDAAGGGIWSNGALTLQSGTTLQANSAIGGNGGDAGFKIVGDFLLEWGKGNGGNGGNSSGGGLYVAGGTATLANASILSNTAQGGRGGTSGDGGLSTGGSAFGGGLDVAAGTVSVSGSTVESNVAQGGSGGDSFDPAMVGTGPSGSGKGGGIYIAAGAAVYLDSYTVTHTTNNTDDSGTNGATANIDGSYLLA